jgi:hypothetical protein
MDYMVSKDHFISNTQESYFFAYDT